ncbi:acetate/propionate family kinase [Ligilactobacillus acidipiscis]|uniref:acetate/propionate family kinase n=1 Tax=Ligilactobacillus acidipiscis TaxID=89059 RepID=UPI0023F80863|nr:acetate kinase [Ligilactobacillus acidipiscis]WEV57909.1 acetate kinase [Ligilactobacillus acidipiscis]
MEILAVNSGSSSFKFKLFVMPEEKVIASGQIERIGQTGSIVTIKHHDGEKYERKDNIKNHKEAVQELMDLLLELRIIKDYSEIDGVGHRVVAGGEYFDHSVIVDENVIAKIHEIAEMAPLHNPANLVGIEAFKKILPQATSVVVFDTAFHQTIPEENFIYSVPYEWYEKYGVRRYGAHGTSHRYVAGEAAKLLGRPLEDLKLVSCHIGAGASICAIKNGKSFDTSMGFTPLTGVTMATRSGDVDVAMISYMMEKLNIDSMTEMIYMLNKESGLLGISGVSQDSRDILQVAHANHRAQLSLDILVKDVVKYIGQYTFEMGGLDGIIFTAGVGENSDEIRAAILERLGFLGITIDQEENQKRGVTNIISGPDSKITVMRIQTDEEVMIARDVMDLSQK